MRLDATVAFPRRCAKDVRFEKILSSSSNTSKGVPKIERIIFEVFLQVRYETLMANYDAIVRMCMKRQCCNARV